MTQANSAFLRLAVTTGESVVRALTDLLDTQDGDLPLLDIIGAELPDEFDWPDTLFDKVDTAVASLQAFETALTDLNNAQDGAAVAIAVGQMIDTVGPLYRDVKSLVEELANAGTFAESLSALTPADGAQFLADVLKAIVEWLILSELRERDPQLFGYLVILGVIEYRQTPQPADPADPDGVSMTEMVVRMPLENLITLFSDPMALLERAHGWGTDAFDPELVFSVLAELYDLPEYANLQQIDGEPVLSIGSLKVEIDRAVSPPGIKISDTVSLPAISNAIAVPLGDSGWQATLEATITASGGYSFKIKPPLEFSLGTPTAQTGATLGVTVDRTQAAKATPISIIGGETSALKVSLKDAKFKAGLKVTDSLGASVKIVPSLEAELKELGFKLSAKNADGFLAALLPPDGIGGSVDLGATWTPDKGVVFKGGGALSATFGVHKEIGPIRLSTIDVRMIVGQETALKLETSVGLGAALGPFDVTIERMGTEFTLDTEPGNLGPFQAGFGFKPPSGLGLKIDSGVVVGGGYLSFDFDRGEYAGTLQLKIGEIEVAAIGMLQTRMADGSPGFSLILILTAEFPALQLGFGFTLNGLGGLLGVNRTTNPDAMRSGLRDRSLDAVLFPDNPVTNARQIISQLGRMLPVQQGQHVLGPMVALGWGTPTILKAELGLFLELLSPVRLILMGRLGLGLPTLDTDPKLVKINMDVLGIIDFDAQFASLDAVLYDSRVGPYSLAGEMAMRLRWGNDPMFALSIGGLHPAFPRPAELPDLARLSLSLGNGNNPRLRLETYMAVTSNSFQVGAALDLYASAAGFWVKGHLGFDALFIFDPFSFEVAIRAAASLGRGGTTLAGVRLSFTLSGPQPWRAKGSAKLKILFFTVKVGFDVSFGDRDQPALPEGDPAAALVAALQRQGNWTALPPSSAGVLLREKAGGVGLMHPMGRLGFRQTVLPLDLRLEKFGNTDPGSDTLFRLRQLRLGVGQSAETIDLTGAQTTREHFAPAQFLDMDDAEKLSSPSFEEMAAGFSGIDGGGLQAPAQERREKDLSMVTLVVGAPPPPVDAPLAVSPTDAILAGTDVSGAARARAERGGRGRYASGSLGLGVPRGGYVLALADDLTEVPAAGLPDREIAPIPELSGANATTRAGLRQALAAHERRAPQDKGRLIIIGRHELPQAA